MHALVLTDKDDHSPLAEQLRRGVSAALAERGHQVELIEIGEADVIPCTGCLLCHTRANGECIDTDAMTPINARIGEVDMVCFLGPIAFGQYGSTMKNVTDKLQVFRMRDRFTVAIGYGEDVPDTEAATFVDIVRKHGGAANVVHSKFMFKNDVYVARSRAEGESVCEQLRMSV
jgi:multimeric flavodoxin WrbA